MTSFTDLGNGTGWIYFTGPGGALEIITNFRNDTSGAHRVFRLGSIPSSRTSSTVAYDTTLNMSGNRIFFDSDAGAVEGHVGGTAIEITEKVVPRGSLAPNASTSATIAAGVLSITRTSNTLTCAVSTEAAAPTDDLDTITYSEAINGDRLILYGPSLGQVTTVRSGTGNIFLTSGVNFVTSTSISQLSLRYWNAGGVPTGWYEISRSVVFPNVANQRAQSVAVPVQGITNLTIPTNGLITLEPGISKGYYYATGSPVLIGNIEIAAGGSPMDGDSFSVQYNATPTIGGFTITIFGITLTPAQAIQKLLISTKYSSSSATWRTTISPDINNLDLVTSAQLATKEDDLGLPAADGMVLSSTSVGVRSWIPNGNFPVLHNDTSNNGTTAVAVEEDLKTYTITGNTMLTDGDVTRLCGVYQTAANANAKTETIYFGATAIGTITGNFNADTVVFEAEINRIDTNNQSATCKIQVFDTVAPSTLVAQSVTYSTPGENLAADVVAKMSSTNGVAAANDSIARQFSVRLFKAQ